MYGCPSGFVDPNEDAFETAIRETKEESGFQKSDYVVDHGFRRTLTYFDPSKNKNKQVHFWLALLNDPDRPVKLSREHQAFRWLPVEEAVYLAKYEDMAGLLRQANQFISRRKAEELKGDAWMNEALNGWISMIWCVCKVRFAGNVYSQRDWTSEIFAEVQTCTVTEGLLWSMYAPKLFFHLLQKLGFFVVFIAVLAREMVTSLRFSN